MQFFFFTSITSKNPGKLHPFSTKLMNSTTVLYYILMISEGSRDSEARSNDAENSALHHRNKLHFKIYSNRKLF